MSRSMQLFLAVGVALSVVAVMLLDALAPVLRMWTTMLLVPLPLLMVLQARQLEDMPPIPRPLAYHSTIISLWMLLGVTLFVAWFSDVTAVELRLELPSVLPLLLWTAVLTATGVALLFVFRALGVHDGDTVRWLMPVTASERALFVGVSITAGVCEEIIFRGFLLHTLELAGAGTISAVALSSAAFGVLHAYQHPAGALRAALLGALLALPAIAGHGIIPSILAHALIDILSGLWLSRYLLR